MTRELLELLGVKGVSSLAFRVGVCGVELPEAMPASVADGLIERTSSMWNRQSLVSTMTPRDMGSMSDDDNWCGPGIVPDDNIGDEEEGEVEDCGCCCC